MSLFDDVLQEIRCDILSRDTVISIKLSSRTLDIVLIEIPINMRIQKFNLNHNSFTTKSRVDVSL